MRITPSLLRLTNGTSGAGSAAAASNAAILGPAACASFDQPAVSRMLAYVTSALPATSENSGASWVQPTISGSPPAAAARNFSRSARPSWRAVATPATPARHGRAVERHRVFARADQDVWRPIGHFVSGYARSAMYFAVTIRAGTWSGKRRLGDWSSDGGHWMPACAGPAPSAALALVRTTL